MIFSDSYFLNIYAFILLTILLITMIVKRETYSYSSRLLRSVIVAIMLILVVEIFSWAFDGIVAPYARVLNYIFNLCFFLGGTIVIGIFASYIDFLIYNDKHRWHKHFYYQHVFVLAAVLAIINFFTPIVFSMDANNVYGREPMMNIVFAAVYLLMLYMMFLTVKNRKTMEKGVYYSIFAFCLIPFFAGMVQMFFFGLLVMWAFVGLGVAIAYIFTETYSSSKDYLTKLYTRALSEEYISRQIELNEAFSLILLDIDDFKSINDVHGHKKGDETIIDFATILKKSFCKDSLVCRYGGDEFLIIVKEVDEKKIAPCISSLNQALDKYNANQDNLTLKYSYGVAAREIGSDKIVDELFDICDKLMYREKAEHKKTR